MKTLLLNAHPDFDNNNHFSIKLQNQFISEYRTNFDMSDLTILNLYEEDIPRIERNDLWSIWEKQSENHALTKAEAKLANRSEFLLNQFKDNHRIVISSPLHNFNITSRLKDYIDNLMIARQTFRYIAEPDAKGKESIGLMTDDYKILFLLASGSIYTADNIYSTIDFAPKYIQTIFQEMMGFESFQLVRAEGTATENGNEILANAYTSLKTEFKKFYK